MPTAVKPRRRSRPRVPEKQIKACVAEWYAVATSTAPIDRRDAQGTLGRNRFGRARFEWHGSPAAAMQSIIDRGLCDWGPTMSGAYRNSAWERLDDFVDLPRHGVVARSLRARVDDPLKHLVREQLREPLWQTLKEWFHFKWLTPTGWGQHEVDWVARYDLLDRVGILGGRPVAPCFGLCFFQAACRGCFWWWEFGDLILCAERPCELHLDDEGRLHNPHGPAMKFPDGFGIYALHGQRVAAARVA